MKLNRTNIVLVTLILIILVQSIVLVFRTGRSNPQTNDVQALKEQVKVKESQVKFWEEQANDYKTLADKAIAKSDSLEKLKPIVKHFYHETYKFIPSASNKQLDSLIRSNW